MKNYLIDMDGVLVSGRTIIPGADQFIARLQASGAEFLVLTNNPALHPGRPGPPLPAIGLDIPAERIFTSAMATARFLRLAEGQRHGLRHRRERADLAHPRGGLRDHRHRPGLRGAGRDPQLQPGADHQGHPAGGRRRALHRHQSRSLRPRRGRPGAGLRRDGRADRAAPPASLPSSSASPTP